ncbi:MAG: hypothetical protein CM1200mP30_19860 [Pseudomonadota bacterium]|nr:MAG: hypothetical protein CM1200mP30_19860 [Pseudomonadota bacterium]
MLHAAAGGVGLIACQWLNKLGVEVIGTVSTDEKAEKEVPKAVIIIITLVRNFAEGLRGLLR